jgi:hypothetical protein
MGHAFEHDHAAVVNAMASLGHLTLLWRAPEFIGAKIVLPHDARHVYVARIASWLALYLLAARAARHWDGQPSCLDTATV